MGMYDTINGEQIKCFSWTSYATGPLLGDTKIDYHNGEMKNYQANDPVPYKRFHYNYTKNFIIFDNAPEDEDTAFLLHVIKNGRLLTSIQVTKDAQHIYETNGKQTPDKNIDQYFQTNNMVIDYMGHAFKNVKSINDCHELKHDLTTAKNNINAATIESQKLWKEYSHARHGVGTLTPGSKERTERMTIINNKSILYHQALSKEKPTVDKIQTELNDKWMSTEPDPTSKRLGEWLSAFTHMCQHFSEEQIEMAKFHKDFRQEFPVVTENMIKNYHIWHESSPKEKEEIGYYFFHMQNGDKVRPTHVGM